MPRNNFMVGVSTLFLNFYILSSDRDYNEMSPYVRDLNSSVFDCRSQGSVTKIP